MAGGNKIPEVRFKGFGGEWEERKLEELLSFKNGINASKERYGKGLKFINVLDIINNRFITHNNVIGLVDVSSDVFEKNKVEYGDILFQRSSETREEVGQSNVYLDKEKKTTFGGFVIRGKKIGEYNPLFINFLLKTSNARKEITTRSGGSTRYNVGQDTLRRVLIYIPSEQEQTKIGNYFQQLDTLITLHQRKYDKLLNVKKAMLEKMFPKKGADVPEIRFKGFSDKWEERKLGEVGETYTGLSGKTKDDFGHGEGRFVTYMNVFSNSIAKQNVTEPIEIDRKQNEVKLGDVFFTTSSETPEEVGMSSVWMNNVGNVYLNSFCFGYRPNEKLDNYYLAYMLRSSCFRQKITFLAQGISRYNISKNKVMDIIVTIPDIKEQTKIGNFFKNLDTLLTLHQNQLEKLKNIKKACLEKMFV